MPIDLPPPPPAVILSEDEFDEQWDPQRREDGDYFEFEDVKDMDPHHVWTVVTDDRGGLTAVPGIHYVNRFGYLTSEQPWPEGYELKLSVPFQMVEDQHPEDDSPDMGPA